MSGGRSRLCRVKNPFPVFATHLNGAMHLPRCFQSIAIATLALSLSASEASASLLHRFSFNDGTAKDSVGSASGTLHGPGATISGGKLFLSNDPTASGDKISHLEFSGPLLPKSGTSVSLVVWFSAQDVGEFSRVLNFGDSEGTEGKQFIYFAPRIVDGAARIAITGSDVGSKTNIDPAALDDGKLHSVAIVIDGQKQELHVFIDGQEPRPAEPLGANTLDKVRPVQNWLGRSSFAADPGFNGAIDEFRVYDHALTLGEAAALHTAGPNTLPPATGTPAAK